MDLFFKVRLIQSLPRHENLPEAARCQTKKRPSSTRLGGEEIFYRTGDGATVDDGWLTCGRRVLKFKVVFDLVDDTRLCFILRRRAQVTCGPGSLASVPDNFEFPRQPDHMQCLPNIQELSHSALHCAIGRG